MHLIEAAWIRPLKKDRPEFLAESRAICSVKLMFYANRQLLELVDETGVDSGDGSLVIMASLDLVIGVHVVAGTAVDERALGERIFVADGEGVALEVLSIFSSLVFGIHVADENLGRTTESGNISTDGKAEAVELLALLVARLGIGIMAVDLLDGKVGILEVLASDVELGNAEVVVTTEADGQGIFNVLLAEGLEVRLGDNTGEVEVAGREGSAEGVLTVNGGGTFAAVFSAVLLEGVLSENIEAGKRRGLVGDLKVVERPHETLLGVGLLN